jgi:hypothetical protein
MARPYSVDLRERVVRAVEAGLSRRAAAAKRREPELRDQADAALAAARRRWPPCPMATGRPRHASLRHDGLTAPCVFDGAINGARFLAYVEQVLARQPCAPATSWCWTIPARTRSKACARRSRPRAPNSAICRPTRPTSRLAPSTDLGGRCGAAR